MTAQIDLVNDLAIYFTDPSRDPNETLEDVLKPYKIQIKPSRADKFEDLKKTSTARQCLIKEISDWVVMGKISVDSDIEEILSDFRIQKKKGGTAKTKQPQRPAEVISLRDYRQSTTDYGPIAGGPLPHTKSSRKICPKCKSLGLHLASGYKEKYYSCLYCGYYKDLETKTYQY